MAMPDTKHWHAFNPLPSDLTPVLASAVGGAGGAFTLSLGGDAGLFTYLTAITISCPNVAAVVSGLITITGITTTLNLQYVETVSAGGMWDKTFSIPLKASGLGTAIVLNVPAIGGGGPIAANMYGYEG